MKNTILTFFLSLILGTTLTHGANVVINPGQSIQTAIDASSAGDILFVSDGIYPENLVVDNKAIEIRGQGDNRPRVYGLTIRNLPSGTFRLSNFLVNDIPNRQITLNGVNQAVFDNVTALDFNASSSVLTILNSSTTAGGIFLDRSSLTVRNSSISGGSVESLHGLDNSGNPLSLNLIDSNFTHSAFLKGNVFVKNSNFDWALQIDRGNLKLLKSTVTKSVLVKHPTDAKGDSTQCIILQSTIEEKLTTKAAQSFVCYNNIRYGYFEGNVDITGNTFYGRSGTLIGLDLNGTSTTAEIKNNSISNYNVNQFSASDACIGIRVTGGAKANILNNLIWDCRDTHGQGVNINVGMGIYVVSDTGTKIMGNIVYNCHGNGGNQTGGNRLVRAPETVILSYNNLWKNTGLVSSALVADGVVNLNAINSDPKLNSDKTLQSSSPCINKGPPDARFNDRDGSRNDIGMFGGHNFIPNGKTTNKPIVLGLDVAPVFVPIGGTTTIESTGATIK